MTTSVLTLRAGAKILWAAILAFTTWLTVILLEPTFTNSPDERAARALIDEPMQAASASNAFAALLLFQWDVPPDQIEAVMAEETAKWPAVSHDALATSVSPTRFPLIANLENDSELLCTTRERGCLAKVRADRRAVDAELAKGSKVLDKHRSLEQFSQARWTVKPSAVIPVPTLGSSLSYALTSAAAQAVDGNANQALVEACQAAQIWRTLRADTNVLIIDMIGVNFMSATVDLVADIAAELPRGTTLPAPCFEALKPLGDTEFDQCDSARAEFAMARDLMRVDRQLRDADWRKDWHGLALLALHNAEHDQTRRAPSYAQLCDLRHRTRILARQPFNATSEVVKPCGFVSHVVDPVGCNLDLGESSAFTKYYDRVLALDARLHGLASALSGRLHPKPDYGITIDRTKNEVVVPMPDGRLAENGEYRIPMAGSRLAQGSAAR